MFISDYNIGLCLARRLIHMHSSHNSTYIVDVVGEGKWMCASIALCLCSALSKEQGVTVLAVCLITDYFIHQKVTYHIIHTQTLKY